MPNSFFRVEMLPARHGDCLWIEYGRGTDTQRILIDGGPVSTFEPLRERIELVPPGERSFELVVLTHVDADHVEGLVRLFAENPLPFAVDDVWFNGWRQMNQSHGLLGPAQGEFLSALLVRRAPRAWDADAPPWVVPKDGDLPTTTLPGGMQITLVSPTAVKLQQMAKEWAKAVKKVHINPGDLDAAWQALATKKKFLPKKGLLGAAPSLDALLKQQFLHDDAKPNGSSIAFLAEFEGKSALFLADAHPDVVASSLRQLCRARGLARLAVDAVKVAHHGSKANTSEPLLRLIDCPRWLISTNGDQFKHPDKPCLARIVKLGKAKELCFNYTTQYTKPWIAAAAQKKYGYRALVRKKDALSLALDL